MEIRQLAVPRSFHKNETNELAPGWPFRMLFVGPSECGKTIAAIGVILDYLNYDYIIVCSKSINGETYKAFRAEIEEREKKNNEVTSMWVMNLDDVPNPEELHPDARTLVIFDDMIGQTNAEKKKITNYYTFGRHHNASIVTMMQSYTGMPPWARESVSHLVIFKGIKRAHLDKIHEDFANDFKNKKNFLTVYSACAEEIPYGYMVIDKKAKSIHRKIRFQFDWFLDPTTLPYSESLVGSGNK